MDRRIGRPHFAGHRIWTIKLHDSRARVKRRAFSPDECCPRSFAAPWRAIISVNECACTQRVAGSVIVLTARDAWKRVMSRSVSLGLSGPAAAIALCSFLWAQELARAQTLNRVGSVSREPCNALLTDAVRKRPEIITISSATRPHGNGPRIVQVFQVAGQCTNIVRRQQVHASPMATT